MFKFHQWMPDWIITALAYNLLLLLDPSQTLDALGIKRRRRLKHRFKELFIIAFSQLPSWSWAALIPEAKIKAVTQQKNLASNGWLYSSCWAPTKNAKDKLLFLVRPNRVKKTNRRIKKKYWRGAKPTEKHFCRARNILWQKKTHTSYS